VSSPLPDDPARWPENPHELLGVPRDVSPRDLRKVYTRLIREYKPEQFPEQFRRIRAAYELALKLAEFFTRSGEPGTPATGGPDKESPPVAAPPGSPRRFDPAEDANALWELAAAGHHGRAYAGLVELFRRQPDQADLPLRLYWLLVLEPEVDPGREPCAWLADELRLTRLSGPGVELLRREFDERPAEALAASDALTSIDAPTDRLGGLLATRAAAAGRLGQWEVVRADLDRGRARVRPTDENSWLQLVIAVADQAAWSAGDDPAVDRLLADCRQEVAALGHLAVNQPEPFDRFEFLLSVADGWAGLRLDGDLPPDLLDLLPAAWNRPFPDVRPLLARVIAQAAAAPYLWLRHLDTIQARNPAAVSFVGNLLSRFEERLEEPPAVPHAPADLGRLVLEFLHDTGTLEYDAVRPHLLAFCLQEAIGPELAVTVAPNSVGGNLLRQCVPSDWPLRILCWSCRLAWA
jgi:hypothetical protein